MLVFGGVGGAGDSYFTDVWLLHVGPEPRRGLGAHEAWWARVATRSPSAPSLCSEGEAADSLIDLSVYRPERARSLKEGGKPENALIT